MGMAPLPREDVSGGTANESPGPGYSRCGRGDQCCCSLCSEESHGDRPEGEILEEKKQSISGSVGIKRSHPAKESNVEVCIGVEDESQVG
jgi:exoribonuclease R